MTTAESESSVSKKEYYDQDYFDSDEDNDDEESSMSVDKPAGKGWFKNLVLTAHSSHVTLKLSQIGRKSEK
jgi:hypothetical protein